MGRYGPALAKALIAASGVGAGASAIDVGCGPGAVTAALVELLGPEGVAAVDPSEPYAEACRARLPGVDVQVAEAERLPFGDDSFDAALAQLVLNFMTDARRGVAEMHRVVRPGGVVAACVWDYAGEMTLLRRFWDAAGALFAAGAERDEGRIMRFCSQDELVRLFSDAGLEAVESGALEVDAGYEDFEDLWHPFERGVGPSGAFATSLADEDRARLREEFHRRLGSPAGPFRLSARAWFAAGRVGA